MEPVAMNAPAVPVTIDVPKGIMQSNLTVGARPRPIVPTDIDQIWRFATIVAKSGMAPKDMQKPETITVAIMHGLEVGLTPLMALQRIAVINGRPSIWGDGAMGLVRASGLCEFVHEAIAGDGDRMVAICRVKRKGEKDPIERTFSVDDAKKAALWGKAGTWQQYPKRMLQMRARAFALRDLFADVLGGLYIAEELEGLEEERSPKDVTPNRVIKGRASADLPPALPARAAPPIDQAEPAVDGAAAPVETQEPHVALGKKPLPPLATPRKPAAEEDSGVPLSLQRNAPPADQPEAFRAWIVAKLSHAKSDEDVQLIWDSYLLPNIEAEQILPPDLQDLNELIANRRKDIAKS